MVFQNPTYWFTIKNAIYGATGVVIKNQDGCSAFSPNALLKMLS
jgi:hypothetical protein